MHSEVERFITAFEQDAIRTGNYRKQLGKYERIFLEEVWGPAFQYNFEGLQAEYPLKDFKGGDRFVDFVYLKSGMRLIFEIDGFTTHARDISPGDFDDHLLRQNDLILSGWLLLRFSANQVERRSTQCQKQILQLIGHWWSLTQNAANQGAYTWSERRKQIIQLALRKEGAIRAKDVKEAFNLNQRTALNWLMRLVRENVFTEVKPNERIIGFRIANFESEIKSLL
jgi:very-short-patch-repair endonuclease